MARPKAEFDFQTVKLAIEATKSIRKAALTQGWNRSSLRKWIKENEYEVVKTVTLRKKSN